MGSLAFGSCAFWEGWVWVGFWPGTLWAPWAGSGSRKATALPRVGLFDGPDYRGKAEQQDGTMQLASTTLIANPGYLQPYCWQVQKSGRAEPTFGVHVVFTKKNFW